MVETGGARARRAVSWDAWQAAGAPRRRHGAHLHAKDAIIGIGPTDTREARRRARRRRQLALLAVLLLAAVVVVALLLGDVFGAGDGTGGGATRVSPSPSPSPSTPSPSAASSAPPAAFGIVPAGDAAPVWPAGLIVPSERTFKADQIERLPYAPEVVFFGGSRSMRFEPAFMKKKTGLQGFNLAMTNGKPEDAWAFAHFLHDRSPRTRLRWVWGVQVSTFYDRDLEAGLVQDPRLNRYLPLDLLEQQGALLPRSPDEVPKTGRVELRKYSPDGVVLFNSYDRAEARGRALERSLEVYIKRALEKQKATPVGAADKKSRSRDYFEATLGYLDSIDARPVILAMPVHPKVLKALRAAGWQDRHDRFLAYIESLRDRYDFEFVDLSEITAFGGDPGEFYDGVHIKAANARRVIAKLVRAFPAGFSAGAGGD